MENDSLQPNFAEAGGLLPAIAQDYITGKVLMLAWMNEQSYRETIQSRKAVYFSRSRNRLWRKGEESGHEQRVKEILLDCDADSILLKVEQSGPACHQGYASCFFRRIGAEDCVEFVESQLKDPAEIYGSKNRK